MGEKELARRLILLLREQLPSGSDAAKALLGWVKEHKDWLWSDGIEAKALGWKRLACGASVIVDDGAAIPAVALGEAVADVLAVDPLDRAILCAAIALRRGARLSRLRTALEEARADLVALLGIFAGAAQGDAEHRVRMSAPVSLGLIEIEALRSGAVSVDTTWAFDKLLNRGVADSDWLADALAGPRQAATLVLEDFAGVAEVGLLVRLLQGALAGRETGINILIHGPPGTGKTELARTLAAAAGAALHGVGEIDEDGDEPTRFDRICALRRAQRILERRGGTILLFDEIEDLISGSRTNDTGQTKAQMGSKIFVNRMLETNAVPVIWTSNEIDGIDRAHLRRMSFVLKLDHPRGRNRTRILARIADSEKMAPAAAHLSELARNATEIPSIARVALRTARIAGGGAEEANLVATALVKGLRDGELGTINAPANLDLELFESDPPIAELVSRFTAPGARSDFSLLLTGPPGTGKTELALHLADGLDRPLHVKRTSDVLSKWVGETERNIADAFAEAKREGAVLLFDEVDSLLADRADAQRSWEVTQVNELLTWLDRHELPVLAATNHAARLDPAALRRFVFKVELAPLSAARSARAFEKFFERPAPPQLAGIGNLTPGDFAVVRRQIGFLGALDEHAIVARLEEEAQAKPGTMGRLGF